MMAFLLGFLVIVLLAIILYCLVISIAWLLRFYGKVNDGFEHLIAVLLIIMFAVIFGVSSLIGNEILNRIL